MNKRDPPLKGLIIPKALREAHGVILAPIQAIALGEQRLEQLSRK